MEENIIKSYYIETARKNFEIAHQQVSVRARLRDNALLVYLTITATVFGIVLKTDENVEILLIIPYLALGISIIVSHHNLIIGTLFDFLKEIRFFLISYNLPGQEVPQYDCSESYENYRFVSLVLRTVGHSIIILMPCIVALILNWKDDFNSLNSVTPAWWFSALCTGVAILGFISIHFLRSSKSNELLSKIEKAIEEKNGKTNKETKSS